MPRRQRLIYALPTGLLIAYIALSPRVVRLTTEARSDFISWWSASAIVLSGSPADVYDSARLWTVEKTVAGPKIGYTGMPYPPFYLMVIAPLARLPYVWALAAWSFFWLAAYALVMFKIDPRSLLFALAFPGAYLNFVSGQTGFLTLVLLGSGVLCLDRRPILAGVFFGACAYKPQLAVLIPVFLVVTARWRALFASAASLASLCLISWAVFGWRTWIAFFHTLEVFRVSVIEQGNPGWEKFQSVFGAARLWGFGVEPSYVAHFLVAAVAMSAAVVIWRRTETIAVQGAALVAATMLVTPYLLHYDTVLLALPIAWLAVDGLRSRFLPGDVVILVLLWLYPLLALALARRGVAVAPIATAAALFVCARRSRGPVPASALTTRAASS